ncbi:MAG TPA: hypothetical protein VMZ69_08485 [Saprospiraceae bacterium]|nr:hypothetical protein [Saprospiraceae bacterium]
MIRNYLFPLIIILFGLLSCTRSGISNKETNKPGDINSKEAPSTTTKPEVIDKEKYLIANNQAGPFKIGSELPGPATLMKYQMRVEQMTFSSEEGPITEFVTVISEYGHTLLWLKPGIVSDGMNTDKTIKEIIVISPKYKTIDKIGVGSSIAEFQNAYPENRIWYAIGSEMYIIETAGLDAQFIIDKSDYVGIRPDTIVDQLELKTEDFQSKGKIKRIRLINYSHKL